jgi:glycosyltransferase involved in cell wall biosynthesis
MKFSVITPSFGQLEFLKLNAVSVADQVSDGVEVEHLVQDGGSTDGTAEWLAGQAGIVGIVEKDEGMYDAINRGLKRARGEVYSWLNCDEQYLPGALAAVAEFFEAHPEVDIAFGHTIVVDNDAVPAIVEAAVPKFGCKLDVFHGRALQTRGGLKTQHLKLNRIGTVVSIKASAATKRNGNLGKFIYALDAEKLGS